MTRYTLTDLILPLLGCLKMLIRERSDYGIVIEQAKKKMQLARLNDASSSLVKYRYNCDILLWLFI